MAKNILIFFPYPLEKNCGGPFTCLYYLKNAFSFPDVNLVFLNDLLPQNNQAGISIGPPAAINHYIKRFIPDKAIHTRRIYNYLRKIAAIPFLDELKKIDLNTFDALHFHEANAMWRFRKLLKNYRGKIIYTPYSPKPFFLEIIEDVYDSVPSKIWTPVYNKLVSLDSRSFQKADIIVAACKEALEGYENLWPEFKTIQKNKNFHYIPFGVDGVDATKSVDHVRKDLSIPQDAFIVCFNGRHKDVKGFDLLVNAAQQILEVYADIYFIVTGKAGSSPAINHQRWIETGWTTEPVNIINACDIVVVPNRQTFFDLNVLMVLSLGKSIILSSMGGNNYFRKFSAPGILFFDINEQDGLYNAIIRSYKDKTSLPELGLENKKLFIENFTGHTYAEKHRQFYLSL